MIRIAMWLSCIVAFACTAVPASWAWEGVTHRALTERAITAIITFQDVLNPAIAAQLGYQDGINHLLDEHSILYWMQAGAEAEDSPEPRVLNHFHNPLQPLFQAGLSDAYVVQLPLGRSAVSWASLPASFQLRGECPITCGEDAFSWHDARSEYLRALTSPSAAERQKALIQTFKALGGVMHLIQDLSNPAHVRNDSHLDRFDFDVDYFHKWGAKPENVQRIFTMQPFLPDPSLLGRTPPPRSPIAVPASLMDIDRYDGTISTLGFTRTTDIGIAEYTNANFLSKATIPFNPDLESLKPWHRFPFPNFDETELYLDTNNRFYKRRTQTAGEPLAYLAHLGYSGHWTIEDDTLSEEYANHLWPRAIGYAGEAVQYFFRGAIMGRIESQGVRIFNRGFEEMNGTFALYCDDTEGMRTPVPVGSGQARLAPDFLQSYLVPVTELAGFTGCVVVFTGIMGEEQDAVVGAELPLGNIGSTVESFTCQSPAACNGDNPHPTCTAITASGTFTAPKSIVWTFFMIAESPPQQPANLVGDAQVQCGDWTAGSLHPNSGIATCTRTTTEQPETTHWTARGAIDMASSGTQTYQLFIGIEVPTVELNVTLPFLIDLRALCPPGTTVECHGDIADLNACIAATFK